MDLATGKTLDLTKGDPDSRRPRWSPDGKWIAYTRTEKGNSDVWIVRPDGSGKRPFITSPGRDEIAVFGPKPVKMPEE
jgi:TolB protein